MDKCPKCKSSWVRAFNPEDLHEKVYWGREILIDGGYIGVYDGIVAVQCPDCKKTFPRDSSPTAKELYRDYLKATQASRQSQAK